MTSINTDRLWSLKVKILASIFMVFIVSLGSSLYGLWSYQRDEMVSMTRQTAMQAGLTIEAGLRSAMLANDRGAIRSMIDNMSRVANLGAITILDAKGVVRISNDSSLLGRVYDLETDETCQACHFGHTPHVGEAIIVSGKSGHLLRSVIKIENKPECYGCHAPENNICGILMVDSFLDKTYDILQTTARRALLTGLMTFFVIVLIISYIITRFVSRPLNAFMGGIKRIETGDFNYWVEIDGGGEFADLAVSFNVMSRAVGRYLDEMKGKTKELTSLYTLVQRISETIEWKKIKIIVVNLICEVMRIDNVALVLPLDGDDKQRFEITWKRLGDTHYQAVYDLESAEDPYKIVSRAELLAWAEEEFSEPQILDDGARALIPLQLNKMRFGLLCIGKAPGEKMSISERKLLPTLAQHIAISFANARLYELAITDELTNLFTKRHFETKIKHFEEKYKLTGEGYGVMMLDLDHFKEVNDTYGHLIGDRLLADMAAMIRANLRFGEIPCRYGGDEFILILPVDDIPAIKVVADRLLNNIADHVFKYEGCPPIKKSVSIGVACCPQHGSTAKELVMIADSALYVAKKQGRNKVVVCPS